jgi:hypothetical protein
LGRARWISFEEQPDDLCTWNMDDIEDEITIKDSDTNKLFTLAKKADIMILTILFGMIIE